MVRKIRAKLVPRLRAEGFSGRQIAAQDMSRHSVAAVLEAADREGVGFDDVADLDQAAVYARLFLLVLRDPPTVVTLLSCPCGSVVVDGRESHTCLMIAGPAISDMRRRVHWARQVPALAPASDR